MNRETGNNMLVPLLRALRVATALLPVWCAVVSDRAAAAHPTNGPDPAALYHNYCSVCHGDKGDGRSRASAALVPAPRDFTSDASRGELSRERIFTAIKYGRPGTAMVSWSTQLSDADMQKLADYVLATFIRREQAGDPRGRAIYAKNCSVCHGDKGEGAVWAAGNMMRAPRNFSVIGPDALSREAMLAAVGQGKPGTAMASFATQLSQEDMGLVVDYIRTALMAPAISGTRAHGGRSTDAPAAASPPPSGAAPVKANVAATFPNGLKGDARRGGAFYQANCATCHGKRGDGQGPRAYFINPKPKSFVDDTARARYSRPVLFTFVSDGKLGTEMPAWRQVIDPQQIADVSEYVLQNFIAAPSAAAAATAGAKK
jgi:mono/diheme cytochrome c family protein